MTARYAAAGPPPRALPPAGYAAEEPSPYGGGHPVDRCEACGKLELAHIPVAQRWCRAGGREVCARLAARTAFCRAGWVPVTGRLETALGLDGVDLVRGGGLVWAPRADVVGAAGLYLVREMGETAQAAFAYLALAQLVDRGAHWATAVEDLTLRASDPKVARAITALR